VLGHIAGGRSYECQVVGIADKVRLSSKSLVNVDATASHQGPNSVKNQIVTPEVLVTLKRVNRMRMTSSRMTL
jgi:hypothetical protein